MRNNVLLEGPLARPDVAGRHEARLPGVFTGRQAQGASSALVAVDEVAAENGEQRREHDNSKDEVALVHLLASFLWEPGWVEITSLAGAKAVVC